MLRLVVLVSGGGSNLADLLERTRDGRVPATIVAVGADQECGGLELARAAGIATFVEPFAQPRAEWSGRIVDQVLAHEPDLTILSGFMRLLAGDAVERLAPNLVNTHPAYLPEFPGAHAVRDALAAGATETGASVIVVDAGVDTGPVLAQVRVPIHPDDDEASLHDRIKPVERDLLAGVVTNWNQES
ncbi:phosphoribosylglycinamide formyltransferase [Agrococcus jejuensis]|uniref:Phosphoribosylglycinamide formyltransferase n=1 Tax=Agrococcus jejuensis TaxID=399736 RepID=A0A1G8BCR5_9MICO|nr:phosphoribosylglycinamide formyltransferase [Agrococcus jejuensis]SDH31027.1 formyltetrahydrofolate-dependent phosphoribosylglycinamide formyltransferase [Agrococcus jejuensis]